MSDQINAKEPGICRAGVLPPGFWIRTKGERGLILYEGPTPLAVVRAPEEKRLRVCVCLVFAARHLAKRNDLRRQEMLALRTGRHALAVRLSDEWIGAQGDYDRAVNLAYGRLGAKRRRR